MSGDASAVYVEVSERSGPIQLRAVTGAGSSQRRWRIRITQFTRRSEGAAPAGCLQHLTGSLGSFESFNYPATGADAGYLVRRSTGYRVERGW